MTRHLKSFWGSRTNDERGAQIVEFAVALPLLVVFVVGIFDFSNAFTLKQRLTNIARDAARAAAGDPSNDILGSATATNPLSVMDVYYVIDNYLVANNLTDCGIAPTPVASGLTWTFTASNGCPAPGLTIIVNRGYYYPAIGATAPGPTCVSQIPGADCRCEHVCEHPVCVSVEIWTRCKFVGIRHHAASNHFSRCCFSQ